MSTILQYTNQLSTPGTFDGIFRFSAPLQLDPRSRKYLRLIGCAFSKSITNIHTYTSTTFNEDTATVRVTRDGGTHWTTIALKSGNYAPYDIEQAITASVAAWYTSEIDPAIVIRGNDVTNHAYIVLDSTKLAAGGTQAGIDLSQSLISAVLGYSAVKTFVTDGEHDSDLLARADWYGDTLSLELTGFGPLSIKDGAQSFCIATIPLASIEGSNTYIYPMYGMLSTKIPLPQCPSVIGEFGVKLVSYSNHYGTAIPVVFAEGSFSLSVELSW